MLDRGRGEYISAAVDVEAKALFSENIRDADAVVYAQGSVFRGKRRAWAFTVNSNGRKVKAARNASTATTGSLTLQNHGCEKSLSWLKPQDNTRACILSDSVNMLKEMMASFCSRPRRCQESRKNSSAAMMEGQANDRADIIRATREADATKYFTDNYEPASLLRMERYKFSQIVNNKAFAQQSNRAQYCIIRP